MTTEAEITQSNHHRAVRYFSVLLLGATTVSLAGNVAHVLPHVSHTIIQIVAAAVPPVALLGSVHGIALAVRVGASGRVYRCAVGAVAAIGAGAFALSFLRLRDLMQTIGCSPTTAWLFPVIADTTIAVSTMMLVALGDKPARHPALRLYQPVQTHANANVGPDPDLGRKGPVKGVGTDEYAITEGCTATAAGRTRNAGPGANQHGSG